MIAYRNPYRVFGQTAFTGVWFFLLLGMVCLGSAASAATPDDRIQPWKENPRFWQYKGKPVMLLGGSDEDNLFNNPELMRQNFAVYEEVGGNYIRSTLSCRDEGNVWPFAKTGDRYDLEQFNPEFWNRLETSFREAFERDIIVQIEVWATFDFYREFWRQNPFNPANNINYTVENTRLETEWDHHPASRVQPFFFSVPGRHDDRVLLKYQEAFVRKVMEVSLPYPNILYCLDNETRAPVEWAHYWGRFIQDEARKRGVPVHVTEMWDIWDIRHEDHKRTYDFPEIFSFVDISQNNWQVGQTHYDNLMWFRNMLAKHPGGVRPMNNVKVYGRTRPGEPLIEPLNLDRWWQNLFAGCASTRFHRPDFGLGASEPARKAIRAARTLLAHFDIFHAEPQPDWLGDREENEAYCLGLASGECAVYFPQGGEVTLQASGSKTRWEVRWMNQDTGVFDPPREVAVAGGVLRLKSPDEGRVWIAWVK